MTGSARARAATPSARLDLDAIERALRELHAAVTAEPERWRKLRREPMSEDGVRRLMEGYRHIDRLLAEGVDIFAYGKSHHLLEINHIVLCGLSSDTRAASAKHMADTERRFYEARPGGVADFIGWLARHDGAEPVWRAAGMFIEIVSAPQLFIEGNQRTASLIAGYTLVRAGLPPVVVTADHYEPVFRAFADIKALDRTSPLSAWRSWRLRRLLAESYRENADRRFLRDAKAHA